MVAIAVYSTMKYVLPGLSTGTQGLAKICQLAPSFAPVITIPLLLLGAKQLYDGTGTEEDQDPNSDDDPQMS
jgi:hypothetical protein